MAYYGEPSMAPELFIKAYTATSEEYQLSEEAPKIDAKNPAGEKVFLVIASHTIGFWANGYVFRGIRLSVLQKMLRLRCCSVRVLCPCWNCFSIDQRNHKVTIKANQSKGNYDKEPMKTRYKNMQQAKARKTRVENARMISPLHLTGWENGARFLNQSRSDAR